MPQDHNCDDLKKLIREVPDFPKPGILFYDITTLLKDKLGFARLIDALTAHYIDQDIDLVNVMRGERIDQAREAQLVLQQGGDVIEENARLGEVGHLADELLQVV